MYPHGVSPRRQRLFEHHVRLHLRVDQRGVDQRLMPWRLHQGISAAAASRLGARAIRGVRALREPAHKPWGSKRASGLKSGL